MTARPIHTIGNRFWPDWKADWIATRAPRIWLRVDHDFRMRGFGRLSRAWLEPGPRFAGQRGWWLWSRRKPYADRCSSRRMVGPFGKASSERNGGAKVGDRAVNLVASSLARVVAGELQNKMTSCRARGPPILMHRNTLLDEQRPMSPHDRVRRERQRVCFGGARGTTGGGVSANRGGVERPCVRRQGRLARSRSRYPSAS